MRERNTYPKISVVIPTYNRAHLLKEALQSVVAQTTSAWEVIVVDNYSEDDTTDVVNSFNDKRIRIYYVNNGGVIARSRNLGIMLAKGEWIAFLDSDDLYHPEKLEKCNAMINESVDLIYHSVELYDESISKTRGLIYAHRINGKPFKSILFLGAPFSTSSVVVRRSAILSVHGFSEDPALIASEDYNCWLKIALKGGVFLGVRQVLGVNRIGGDNLSRRDMSLSLRRAYLHFKEKYSKEDSDVLDITVNFYHSVFLFKQEKSLIAFSNVLLLMLDKGFRISISWARNFFLPKSYRFMLGKLNWVYRRHTI